MNEQKSELTDLQRAMIEHDDDMTRLDRNRLPVSQPPVVKAPNVDRVWQQVRDSLNREGTWSPAMTDVFKGFFISGWNHRGITDALTAPASSITEKAQRAVDRFRREVTFVLDYATDAELQQMVNIITAEFTDRENKS
jgi:hypothetical protein